MRYEEKRWHGLLLGAIFVGPLAFFINGEYDMAMAFFLATMVFCLFICFTVGCIKYFKEKGVKLLVKDGKIDKNFIQNQLEKKILELPDEYEKIINENFKNFNDNEYIKELYKEASFTRENYDINDVRFEMKGDIYEDYSLVFSKIEVEKNRNMPDRKLDMMNFVALNIPQKIDGVIRIIGRGNDSKPEEGLVEVKTNNAEFDKLFRVYTNDLGVMNSALHELFIHSFVKAYKSSRIMDEGIDVIIKNNNVFNQIGDDKFIDYNNSKNTRLLGYGIKNEDEKVVSLEKFKLTVKFALDIWVFNEKVITK